MPVLAWDETGKKFYETGVDKVALYLQSEGAYPNGVAWSGVTAITETASGAEPNPFFADNQKYINLISAEEFGLTIEAFQYPEEFGQCDGSAVMDGATGVTAGQQGRKTFGLAYRTKVGNDGEGTDHAYKIHLVYGLTASPSERNYTTVNDSPEPMTMSWECTSIPENVTDMKATSHIIIDSRTADGVKLKAFETTLWGEAAELPLPDDVKKAFSAP